jgi:hypothetical protein
MLSVLKLIDSPAGTRFMLPEAALEVDKREYWPVNLRAEYVKDNNYVISNCKAAL